MRKTLVLMTVFTMILVGAVPTSAQGSASTAVAVVLDIDNEMTYIRAGWQQPVLVQAGTMLSVDDLVFPQETSLLVLCPDGSLKDFVPGELFPNDKLNCGVPRESYVLNVGGIDIVSIQRGGRQDPTIPYLISPRRTLVRSQDVTFEWNAPLDVMEYQLRVFGGGSEVLPQTRFMPEEVTQGDIARVQVELALQPDVPYSVEICVTFQDLRQGCTTDPGWTSGTDVAFYYVPDPQLVSQSLYSLEQDIITALGADTPESLYARAVLLSQHVSPHDIGFTHEAIDLLNQLISQHPDRSLALTPEVFNRLGDLYSTVNLPLSAARAFFRATELGVPCTETIAQAYLGLALNTPDPSSVNDLLNQALDEYHCLLQPPAFADQYTELCDMIGDSCADLRPLLEFEGQS